MVAFIKRIEYLVLLIAEEIPEFIEDTWILPIITGAHAASDSSRDDLPFGICFHLDCMGLDRSSLILRSRPEQARLFL